MLHYKATVSRFDVVSSNADGSISIRKGSRIKSKAISNTEVATKRKKKTVVKIDTKLEVSHGRILLDLPIKTVSEANCFEPWQVKHGRHKEQKKIVSSALSYAHIHASLSYAHVHAQAPPQIRSAHAPPQIRGPCKIFLTRFAPDELDKFDNLPMSFKYIVDAVCAIITGNYVAGQADSDKRISISCDQVKSKAYGVRIEITFEETHVDKDCAQ